MSPRPASSNCPTCLVTGVPVIWGKPSAATLRAHDRGLARVGGCIVRGGPHSTWWCSGCEQSFQGIDTRAAIDRIQDELD